MKTFDVTVAFAEPLLGTAPLNKETYTTYIQEQWRKAHPGASPDPDEAATIEESLEVGTTGFHRSEDGQPFLYDYAVKGFFKDACGMLFRDAESASSKVKAYRKVIDGLIFVTPRRIPLALAGEVTMLERPLRAQTAQGERVALARSESAPAGSSMAFVVTTLGSVSETLLREWFTYGALRGMGQWRNSGMGRFDFTLTAR
jgi:hypothetical protein